MYDVDMDGVSTLAQTRAKAGYMLQNDYGNAAVKIFW